MFLKCCRNHDINDKSSTLVGANNKKIDIQIDQLIDGQENSPRAEIQKIIELPSKKDNGVMMNKDNKEANENECK